MCGAHSVLLSGQVERHTASGRLGGVGTRHIALVTALTSAGCIATAAVSFALWTSVSCWVCYTVAWLLVEATFYFLQWWRYAS